MHWKTWLKFQLMLATDRLFSTDLVERELVRRQIRIAQLDAQLAQINQQLATLSQNSRLYQTALYLTLLQARSESHAIDDWLCFTPESDSEEQLLEGLIDCLVKPRLAAIDVTPLESQPGDYVYRLHPDWEAIRVYLGASVLTTELETWLLEEHGREPTPSFDR